MPPKNIFNLLQKSECGWPQYNEKLYYHLLNCMRSILKWQSKLTISDSTLPQQLWIHTTHQYRNTYHSPVLRLVVMSGNGVWIFEFFVLFNDAWSQQGHSASYTTAILASTGVEMEKSCSNTAVQEADNWYLTTTNFDYGLQKKRFSLTRPLSMRFVIMTITEEFCSHTIVQKSANVDGRGPWAATYAFAWW